VSGVTTSFVWDGDQLVLEQMGTTMKKYIRGLNLAACVDGQTVTYYLFNAHGDVVQLTDAAGEVTKNYEYDAFGVEENPSAADSNPFRYCGEYLDLSSGTYYLRARYYDPTIGRFLSEDTYTGDIKDPLSLNLYTYSKNNPVKYYDPSGHSSEERLGEGIWSFKSDTAGRTMLAWYLFSRGSDFISKDGYYGKYMMKNSILTTKVKDMILPYGNDLSNNQSIDIDIVTSMEIQNGEDVIGYQYLHGTNADAGGFTIKGSISKNDKGDVTYDLTYTWDGVNRQKIIKSCFTDNSTNNMISLCFVQN
jgi:RHS repeat-associated protein